MTDRSGLTQEEQAAIEVHARRRSAFLSLKKLVDQWRAELELQEKADRIVARVCGGIVAILSLATAAYLLFGIGRQVMNFAVSPVYAVRISFWYLAAIAVLVTVFCAGFSYATWSVRPTLERAAMYALPTAIFFFIVGLIVAPFIAWLVAS